jgi:hypothetical protein
MMSKNAMKKLNKASNSQKAAPAEPPSSLIKKNINPSPLDTNMTDLKKLLDKDEPINMKLSQHKNETIKKPQLNLPPGFSDLLISSDLVDESINDTIESKINPKNDFPDLLVENNKNESLKIENKKIIEDDFPTLEAKPIQKSIKYNEYPALSSLGTIMITPASIPPPGFGNQKTSSDMDPLSFIKVIDFDERNNELMSNLFLIFSHYNAGDFEKFKSHSSDFKKGLIDADDYLKKCFKLLQYPVKSSTYTSKQKLGNSINFH